MLPVVSWLLWILVVCTVYDRNEALPSRDVDCAIICAQLDSSVENISDCPCAEDEDEAWRAQAVAPEVGWDENEAEDEKEADKRSEGPQDSRVSSLFRWGKRGDNMRGVLRWGKRDGYGGLLRWGKRVPASSPEETDMDSFNGIKRIFRWGKRSLEDAEGEGPGDAQQFRHVFRWGKRGMEGAGGENAAEAAPQFRNVFRWGKRDTEAPPMNSVFRWGKRDTEAPMSSVFRWGKRTKEVGSPPDYRWGKRDDGLITHMGTPFHWPGKRLGEAGGEGRPHRLSSVFRWGKRDGPAHSLLRWGKREDQPQDSVASSTS